jgi:hypothetical protein
MVALAGRRPDPSLVATITGDPPAEIAAASRDRCIIPIKRGNVDAWLDPNGDVSVLSHRLGWCANRRRLHSSGGRLGRQNHSLFAACAREEHDKEYRAAPVDAALQSITP